MLTKSCTGFVDQPSSLSPLSNLQYSPSSRFQSDPTSAARGGVSWHPDGGTLLAVPGNDNDVVLYERLSWTPTGYLSGGHTAPVNLVVFCPNGEGFSNSMSLGS